MGLLSENSGQKPDNSPAEETAVSGRVAPIEKRVCFLTVAMDVAVNPNMSLFLLRYLFKQKFSVPDLRLVVLVWVDPLSVQIDA